MKKQKLAKVSPWILAAAGALLTLIIGVFAVNNYQREKELMKEAMLQRGVTIARFIASSARASLRGSLRSIRVAVWEWTDHVQQAIDSSVEQPDLHFIGLIDDEGNILASTRSEKNGSKIDPDTFLFIKQINGRAEGGGHYRFFQKKEPAEQVFQVAAIYHPFGQRNFISRLQGRGFFQFGRPGRMGPGPFEDREMLEQFNELRSRNFTLLVELDLTEYNRAVHGQLLQILSLSLVLLLVGIGGWLSLLTLQGFKGSQIRLRQIREYTDLLVSSLPVGLIATDDAGSVRIFNKAAEEMLNVQAGNAIGFAPDAALPNELANELQRNNRFTAGTVQNEIQLRDGSRGDRSFMTLSLPVVDSKQRFAGNTLLVQDVSHIKELQKELRRSERLAALGKMAAGVAHELRNPLSSIKGLALLLKSKIADDEQGENTADILVREVERLNRSIGELLDYARPQQLSLKKINISEVLEKSISLIEVDLQVGRIDLQKEWAKEVNVRGDRDKLNQVFLNLLLNALQALEKGGSLRIATVCEGARLVVIVEDNGCGLEEENVAKVFDPYFTTKRNGTGLGLAMSAKIIEEHSGSIEFESTRGRGTTVRVNLPLYLEES